MRKFILTALLALASFSVQAQTPTKIKPSQIDLGTYSPTMFYGGKTVYDEPLSVTSTLSGSLPNTWHGGIRSRVNSDGTGCFTSVCQTAQPIFNADGRMRGYGQLMGTFVSLKCLGIGNCMGGNWVIEGWNGTAGSTTGHAQTQITGLGELNMKRGAFTANKSTFKVTINGAIAPGSTAIPYTPVANEEVVGLRRIYNITKRTTGDGAAVKITGISGSTVTFAGTTWTASDVGRFLKVGSNNEGYVAPCNGNDVVIDSVCTGDYDQITAVNSNTEVVIENAYDTVGLTAAWPQAFMVVDGDEVASFDEANNTLTIKANTHAWSSADVLISPPESHGEFLGINVLANPVYKRRGAGTPTSGMYVSGTNSASPLDSAYSVGGYVRYGIDFTNATFSNPQRAFNMAANTGFWWGTNFLSASGGTTYTANNTGDAAFCQYITAYDTTNYERTCLTSGTTWGGLRLEKNGTGSARPLYIWNNTASSIIFRIAALEIAHFTGAGTLQWESDGLGNIGTAGNYRPDTIYAKTAVNTPKLAGVTDTAVVTNLNADQVDGYHAASLAPIVNVTQVTAQTASIGLNSIYSATTAGDVYRVSAQVLVTTVGTAGTVSVRIYGKGVSGVSSPDVVLTALTGGSVVSVFYTVSSADAIGYATTVTGATGSPQYRVVIVVEKIV